MDKDFIERYGISRKARPVYARQEWTVNMLNRQVPLTPQKFDPWDPIMSSCITTCLAAGGGGYVIGLAFGFVFSAMEQNEIDTKVGFRAQFAQAYRGTWTKMKSQARAFGGFGALYMAFECPLENFRATRDPFNSFLAGTFTGSTFALFGHSGPRSTLFAGLSCGVFCMLIEMVMHR